MGKAFKMKCITGKVFVMGWILAAALIFNGCSQSGHDSAGGKNTAQKQADIQPEREASRNETAVQKESAVQNIEDSSDYATEGTEKYEGFLLDNVLHSENEGEIHYNVYIPGDYDGSQPFALFFTLPGYQGLYFQGVGMNIRTEQFGFTAQNYHQDMIVVAPQLEDWGETSARQTIALVKYFLSHYNIDENRVYANGYSGGGETMSLVMGMEPDLFTAYLHCSSKWDGDYEPVVKARTPVYLVIGENDEYYGSEPSKEAYGNLHELYKKEGLSEKEIDRLLVLDIKDSSYFDSQGVGNQHGGGGALFSQDEEIMGWLFGNMKE